MLGAARKSADQLAALDRIAAWTGARFSLPAGAAILVSETACSLPGCPPLETVVAFWTPDACRHHFKLFKPALAVVEADLPYAWLMKSLAVPEGFTDDCC